MLNTEDLPEILPPTVDIVFKMLFGNERNKEFLIKLLEAVLEKNINNVFFLDTAIKPEYENDKTGILDVKAKLDSEEIIDIEIQVRDIPEMRHRITYYSAGMITEQIGRGEDYLDIKPAISIIIVAKTLINESEKCHNVFSMLERDEYFPFNNLQEIHILDLSRIRKEKERKLADWLSFINSKDKEEFMAIAQRNKDISAAFDQLKVLSADKSQRMLYEARLKEQRDIRSMNEGARRQGIEEGMQMVFDILKQQGIDVNLIKSKLTN